MDQQQSFPNETPDCPSILYPPGVRLLPPSVLYPHTYRDLVSAPALHGVCVFAFDMLIGPVVWAQWPPGIMPQEKFREISDMVVCGDEFANTTLTLHIPRDPAVYATPPGAVAFTDGIHVRDTRNSSMQRIASSAPHGDQACKAPRAREDAYDPEQYMQLALFPVNVQVRRGDADITQLYVTSVFYQRAVVALTYLCTDTKYYRNSFFFSIAFILPAHAPSAPYCELAREVALFLEAVERDSGLMLGQTKEERSRLQLSVRDEHAGKDSSEAAAERAGVRLSSSAANASTQGRHAAADHAGRVGAGEGEGDGQGDGVGEGDGEGEADEGYESVGNVGLGESGMFEPGDGNGDGDSDEAAHAREDGDSDGDLLPVMSATDAAGAVAATSATSAAANGSDRADAPVSDSRVPQAGSSAARKSVPQLAGDKADITPTLAASASFAPPARTLATAAASSTRSTAPRASTRPRDELLAQVLEAVLLDLPMRGHSLITAASGHTLRLSVQEWSQPFRVHMRAWNRELFWRSEKGRLACSPDAHAALHPPRTAATSSTTSPCATTVWDSSEHAQWQRERDMRQYVHLAGAYPAPVPLPAGTFCPRELRRRRALLRERVDPRGGLTAHTLSSPTARACGIGEPDVSTRLYAAFVGIQADGAPAAAPRWGWYELEQNALAAGRELYGPTVDRPADDPTLQKERAARNVCPCACCCTSPESVPVRVSGWAQLEHVLGVHQRHYSPVHSRGVALAAPEDPVQGQLLPSLWAASLRGQVSCNDHFCEDAVLVAVYSAVDDVTPVWRLARSLQLSLPTTASALELLCQWGVLSMGHSVEAHKRYRLIATTQRAHWCRDDCGLFVCVHTLQMALAYATTCQRFVMNSTRQATAEDSVAPLSNQEAALLQMLTDMDPSRGWRAAETDTWGWLWGAGSVAGIKSTSKSKRLQSIQRDYTNALEGVCFIRLFTYLTHCGEVEEEVDAHISSHTHAANGAPKVCPGQFVLASEDYSDADSCDWCWWADSLSG